MVGMPALVGVGDDNRWLKLLDDGNEFLEQFPDPEDRFLIYAAEEKNTLRRYINEGQGRGRLFGAHTGIQFP